MKSVQQKNVSHRNSSSFKATTRNQTHVQVNKAKVSSLPDSGLYSPNYSFCNRRITWTLDDSKTSARKSANCRLRQKRASAIDGTLITSPRCLRKHERQKSCSKTPLHTFRSHKTSLQPS